MSPNPSDPAERVVAIGKLLFRAAVAEQVDLGDERSVSAWWGEQEFPWGDTVAYSDEAIDWARAKLQRRSEILTELQVLPAVLLACALLAMPHPVQAFATADGPTPSTAGAILVVLIPGLIIGAIYWLAGWRGSARPVQDEPIYGDTTRFGEVER